MVSRQLTLSSLQLQSILNNIPQGVVVASAPQGRIMFVNKELTQLLGREIRGGAAPNEYVDIFGFTRAGGERYQPEDLPWVQSARASRWVAPQEIVAHPPGRPEVTLLVSASPIVDDLGKTIGSVSVLQDISQRKQFERQKDQFLAMVAHELKTPLTSLKGYAQLLLRRTRQGSESRLKPQDTAIMQVFDRQVNRLARLVSNLVDFSMIQAGRLAVHPTRFTLGALAQQVVTQMQMAAPDRRLSVRVEGDTSVEADLDRIEQVLTNLIANGIKATGEGGVIQVLVRRVGDKPSGVGRICVDVGAWGCVTTLSLSQKGEGRVRVYPLTPNEGRHEPTMASESDPDSGRRVRLARRRRLRRESTDAELLLWRLLRDRQLAGAKFRRQHHVGPYVLDFYCPEQRVAVEADGGQHLTPDGLDKDDVRTRYLESKGIRVLRFSNVQILVETEAVQEGIRQAVTGQPSPSPSPLSAREREGSAPTSLVRKGEGMAASRFCQEDQFGPLLRTSPPPGAARRRCYAG